MEKASEILANLSGFYGTQDYQRVNQSLLTDGVAYLCEAAECFWLIDIVNSILHLPSIRQEEFLTIDMETNLEKGQAVVIVTDGNKNELYRQNVKFTDFPLEKIRLYRANNVVMLPSEY